MKSDWLPIKPDSIQKINCIRNSFSVFKTHKSIRFLMPISENVNLVHGPSLLELMKPRIRFQECVTCRRTSYLEGGAAVKTSSFLSPIPYFRPSANEEEATTARQSFLADLKVCFTFFFFFTMAGRMIILGLLYVTLALFESCRGQKCEKMTALGPQDAIAGTKVNVRLLLYTRENVSCGHVLSHETPFDTPDFKLNRPTTFLIHGYRPTGSPPVWLDQFVEFLLERSNINVIVVDWNRGATSVNYLKVVKNTRVVAGKIIDLIQKMKENGTSLSSIHMIGVSLGAHISGFTGQHFSGELGRITALDPAGPQFNGLPPSERLDSSDALFVEALHTDMDALGYRSLLGHIDYYPNGGADQPGCPKTIFSGSEYFKCDHQRSVFLYISSVNGSCPIIAYPCDSYADFLDGKCMDCGMFKSAGCPVFGYDSIRWKDSLVQLGETRTYFRTTNAFPFCKFSYKVDIVTWNQETQWGYLTVKLQNGTEEAQVKLNHKNLMFKKYVEISLLAQFDSNVEPVQKVMMRFCSKNGLKKNSKLRVLRVRLTPLQGNLRPLCRYDLTLMDKEDVTFRPIPCEDFNF